MSNRCECGHHQLSHTYNRHGNAGPCLAERLGTKTCDCDQYEPADTEEES